MRYMRRLADRDLALDRSMIPLGSCTMKLNAAAEMIPLSWPEFSDIHPFAPADQAAGYAEMLADLIQSDQPGRCEHPEISSETQPAWSFREPVPDEPDSN